MCRSLRPCGVKHIVIKTSKYMRSIRIVYVSIELYEIKK